MTPAVRLDPGVARFDLMRALRELAFTDLQRVAARFAPEHRRQKKPELLAQIDATLTSEARLDAVVERLAPLERLLLTELARRGGVAQAAELATFAALRGHAAPAAGHHRLGSDLSHPMGVAGTAAYLAGLVDDGLMVRGDRPAVVAALGPAALRGDPVLAEPRLLARVWARAAAEPVPPVVGLTLAPAVSAPAPGRHPMGVVLELLDVLHAVADQGGVVITKERTIARPFLKRLAKLRPHLADRLEPQIHALSALGLLRPPSLAGPRQPWTVHALGRADLLEWPPQLLYAAVVDATARHLDPRIEDAWRRGRYLSGGHGDLWRALLDALPALPPHPVRLEEAAEALWRQVLVRVFGHGRAAREPLAVPSEPRPRAIDVALAGPLATLGLLTVSGQPPTLAAFTQPRWTDPDGAPRSADPCVVAPGPGLAWYAEARSIAQGHRTLEAGDRSRARGLDPRTGAPLQPSLLVQPNFEVHAYLDRLSSSALPMLACTTTSRIDAHTAGFVIDRWSVHRALGLGLDLEALLDGLRTHAGAVPGNVAQAMRDWARRRDRLKVTVVTRLLEYPDTASRDAALEHLKRARAVATRFVLLDPDEPAPSTDALDYREPPARTLTIGRDGSVKVVGAVDLPGRALLARVTVPGPRGHSRFDPDSIRAGALGAVQRELLAARVREPIPPQVDVLLRTWAREGPPPSLSRATLFHHPRASAWAQQPSVAAHLGEALNDSTYLVQPGAEARLAEALRALGIELAAEDPGAADADRAGSTSGAAGRPPTLPALDGLIAGLSTRKTRERLQEAIAVGLGVELRYVEERERYDRYGSVKRSKGRLRTARVVPQEVVHRGTLPYLRAIDTDGERECWIRIGYVVALALRPLEESEAER